MGNSHGARGTKALPVRVGNAMDSKSMPQVLSLERLVSPQRSFSLGILFYAPSSPNVIDPGDWARV